jgi:hypothetical protein
LFAAQCWLGFLRYHALPGFGQILATDSSAHSKSGRCSAVEKEDSKLHMSCRAAAAPQAQHEQRVSHLTRRAEAAESKVESLTAQLAAAELAVASASSAANSAASSASSEVATARAEAEAVRGELAAAKRDAEAEKNK